MTFGGIVADLGSALEALAKWSNANQGLVAVIAAVVTALVTIAAVLLTHWLGSRKAAPAPRSGEINYLIALEQYLLDLQKMPLAHDESEILALHAEMVLPQYRIFDATSPKDNSGRKGQTTRNLAHALLASDKPVVVKGDPGAGKSVSLRRVGLDLARRERARKHPRLPIYLRLGTFTQPVDADPQSSVLDFVRRSLHAFGGTANTVLEHFDEYLAEGRFVFLFDAMDEMPRADYEARFN